MHTKRSQSQLTLSETLAWMARGLTLAMLLIAPWPYAMAQWASQVWLVPVVGAILVLASLVALLQRISVGNPLIWSLTAVLVIGLLQVVPLPESAWETLSAGARFERQVTKLAREFAEPESAEIEQAETEPGEATSRPPAAAAVTTSAGPRTLSIYPLQTRATCCVFAMGLALLISASILFRDRLSVALLLGSLSLSGLAIALAGIYQAVVPGDWTLLEDIPKGSSFGTFFSRNSAPQFLACCFAATGGLLAIYVATTSKLKQDKRYQITYPSVNMAARLRRRFEDFVTQADLVAMILLLIMAVQMIGILVANSRGGILAFFASGLTIAVVYAAGRQTNFSASLAVLVLIIGAGVFLASFGLDDVIGARMDTISEEAYKLDNARLGLWKIAISQPNFWLLGSGLGTFHFAILPAYLRPQATWFYHAENIYVELASGAGVVTLLIASVGLIWLLWNLLSVSSNSNTTRAARFACLFAVLAVGLQNLVDFSLILPAIFLPVAALVGAYWGARNNVRRKVKQSRHRSRSHSSSDKLRPGYTRKKSAAAQSQPTSQPTSQPPAPAASPSPAVAPASQWAPASLVVCILLISLAVAMGVRPLAAFAFAEQLRNVKQVDVDKAPKVIDLITAANQSPWSRYPESQLQIGRWRQELAVEQLLESPRWPVEVGPAMRQSLAHPEFFNTVFHEHVNPELLSLKEFLDGEASVLENLSDSQAEMQFALQACPLDWRASWGVMRSDLGHMSSAERQRNYARILSTCRNNQAVMQAAGTHALMIGEDAAGLEIWRQLLPVSSRARLQVVRLLGRFLSIEQLVSILPEDPLQRIELARSTQRPPAIDGASDAIVATVDIEAAFQRASYAADWPLVAWCAEQQGNLEWALKAWEQAVLDDTRNHLNYYYYALALERAGNRTAAIEQLREALNRAASDARYLKQLSEWEESQEVPRL